MTDVLGQAIYDYYHNRSAGRLWIHNTYGKKEEMPVDIYFRNEKEMPELELLALAKCRGKILDIGAGAGSHALALQRMNKEVTALEISEKACDVMKQRGVQQVICGDVFGWQTQAPFDTLLLLMNGIGLCGTINGLTKFLEQATRLLMPDGQLLFDSSDIAYLYKGKLPQTGPYYGELTYQYQYGRQKTAPFQWLYIDRQTLTLTAAAAGWKTEWLTEDEWGQYLVRLVRN